MKRNTALKHEFVEYIPDELADGTIYVCMTFATVSHRCCCGCGKEVVTPLSPSDWKLTFDGEAISLVPSMGNWSFPCQSHYWIVRNSVRWAEQWSQEEIAAGRAHDALAKERYFEAANSPAVRQTTRDLQTPRSDQMKPGILVRLKKRFFG